MGVNVVYAPVCDLADEPGQPAPRHPLVRRRAGGRGPAGRGASSAGCGGRRRGRGKHFPGIGDVDLDTHHGLAVVDARPGAAATRAELVPFRAAIEAGADVSCRRTSRCPALTGDADLPATLSRDRDARPAARRPRVPRPDDHRRARHGGAAPGRRPGRRRRSRRSAPASTCCCAWPEPVAQARIEAALAARRGARAVRRRRAAGVRGADRRAARGGWRRSPSRPSRSSGRREHQALARELAERSVTLVRDDGGPAAAAPRAGARVVVVSPARATSRRPTRRRRSRPAWPPRSASATPRRRGGRRRRSRRTPRSPRSAAAARRADLDRRRHDQRLAPSPPRPRSCEALARDRRAGRHRRPAHAVGPRGLPGGGDPRLRLRDPPSRRCEALAAALFGERPFRGRLPAPIAGLYPVGHGLPARPRRRCRWACATRSASSRRSSRACSRRAAEIEADRRAPSGVHHVEHVVIAARGTSDHAAIYAQYLFGIRLRLPVGARDAVDRVAVRRGAAVRAVARHRDQPVGRVAGHRRRGRRRPAARARRRSRSRTSPARRWPQAAEHVHRPRRRARARGRRDEDLHGRAARDRAASRPRSGRRRDRTPRRCAAVPDAIEAALATEDAARDAAPAHAAVARCVVAGPRLRVRDGARVGAQAQGAGPRRRRPVLGRGLPPRAARARRARLSRCSRSRRRAPPPPTWRRCCASSASDFGADLVVVSDREDVRASASGRSGPGGRPRAPAPIVSIVPGPAVRATTRRSPAASTPMRPRHIAR